MAKHTGIYAAAEFLDLNLECCELSRKGHQNSDMPYHVHPVLHLTQSKQHAPGAISG